MQSITPFRSRPDIPAVQPPGRISLIGAGAFGRFCLDAYRKSGDLTVLAVADQDAAALDKIDGSSIRLEREWRSLLRDDAIEVVHLATPPDQRAEMALAALAAGKSVFCEKPLALHLVDADAIIKAANQVGATVGIDYVMRHHPAYQALEALSSSGLFGSLRSISLENHVQRVPEGHWFWDPTRSGGILVEHGVHFFDAFGRLAGGPCRVSGSVPHPEAVEVTVQYEGGATGRFYHDFAFPQEVERTVGTTFFERGYIEIEGWIPTRLHAAVLAQLESVQRVAAEHGLVASIDENGAVHVEASFADRQLSYQTAIVSGMRDVLHSHRNREYHLKVTSEDARDSLALAIVAQRAAVTGCLIELSE